MSHFVILDANDVVIDQSAVESSLAPGNGEYVAELSDRHVFAVGEPLGRRPEVEGQESML